MFEGWHIKTKHNNKEIIWIIKGYEHPKEGFISIPYRISGKRVNINEIYEEIKDYYLYLDCVGKEVPVVKRNEILKYYDPKEIFIKNVNILPKNIIELVEFLKVEYAGLVGSYLLGYQKKNSDVDLILYGNNNEIYENLLQMKREGLIFNCIDRYDKVSDTMTRSEYELFAQRRVLDSCYKGIPYTIRILRQIYSEECRSIYKTLKSFKGEIEIYDNKENFLVPSIYLANSIDLGKVEIMTWHTRYMELPLGRYYIEGVVQLNVKDNRLIVVPDQGGRIDPIEIWS
ncbi:hypothetical protein Calag_1355 [Caldisphaera lagunensis DSM 15908]|uniref:Polymerase nucleotidyl transferase domain-containing protein n=1 Tax=Caldisphaera lagunensis (strain DSM 15908 / JCM 11604 / ANMR 0165 / IC-154) TaxID=1056495 RepID=L0ACB0_CALLD|nr:nucleotidyltransferase domain-containing protein [Caldisphaera lagunensis]AFZ71064.1 hypothetical protein Calag_1355 [Caldisphaera lagunensis DSM 15908]